MQESQSDNMLKSMRKYCKIDDSVKSNSYI